MNIAIISHERSLNKAESLIQNLHQENRLFLIVEQKVADHKSYTSLCHQIIVIPGFELERIFKNLPFCDKVICTSENLLPLQSALEDFFNIENLSAEAARILSNKFELHNFCMKNGLEGFCPNTLIPTSEESLNDFQGKIIVKPDIGTGSNRFLPEEFLDAEYKVWNSVADFLKFLSVNGLKDKFFKLNRDGIKTERFNDKPCRILIQEYIQNDSQVYAACGLYRNGKANIAFFAKTNPDLFQIGEKIEEVGNLEVSSAFLQEVPAQIVERSKFFIEKLLGKLEIKELFFAGPDIYSSNGQYYAIDFNPRLGHFFNLIDKVNKGSVFRSVWNENSESFHINALWKAAKIQEHEITSLNWLTTHRENIPKESCQFSLGDRLPLNPTLQSKPRSIQLLVTGKDYSELLSKFKKIESEISIELSNSFNRKLD